MAVWICDNIASIGKLGLGVLGNIYLGSRIEELSLGKLDFTLSQSFMSHRDAVFWTLYNGEILCFLRTFLPLLPWIHRALICKNQTSNGPG